MRAVPVSRRQFLVRCGLLGAVTVTAGVPSLSFAATGPRSREEIAAALQTMSLDTIGGLVAFVVPGQDRYSVAQGFTSAAPGGVDARAPEGMVALFEEFLPMPDTFIQAMAAGFAGGMSDVPVPGLERVLRDGEQAAATLDRAFAELLGNDETVPLSMVVALMLNFVATSVDARSIAGPIPSAPFANLSFEQKAEVLRRIEEDHAELAALVDGGAGEPMRGSLSGQIQYIGGALPAAAALYSYNEWGVFDPESRLARRRPIGWDLTSYAPGRTAPPDGWKELKGYYGGHRRARSRRARARARRRGRRA